MIITIAGDEQSGFWVNLEPGQVRLSVSYPTAEDARCMLAYHQRTCGIHPLPEVSFSTEPKRSFLTRIQR